MSEQSQGAKGIRDARMLGIPKMLLLGIQHMFAMFGATILVPILTNVYFEGEGLSVQVTLICAGLGTLFFHLCSKMKVPAFLGSSFAYVFALILNAFGVKNPDGSAILTFTLTGLAIAGIVMNAILPGNDYEFGTNEKGDGNRGVHA